MATTLLKERPAQTRLSERARVQTQQTRSDRFLKPRRVSLYVTILPGLRSELQKALQACGPGAEVLDVRHSPDGERTRIRLGVREDDLDATLEAIIRTLSSGEIGRIARL